MPAANLAVRAVKKDRDPTKRYLAVEKGEGSGEYAPGDSFKINSIPTYDASGYLRPFDKWTALANAQADLGLLKPSVSADPATGIMPDRNVYLEAFYGPPKEGAYVLTVSWGTGSPLRKNWAYNATTKVFTAKYDTADKVLVASVEPPAGKVFDKWTGSVSLLADSTGLTDGDTLTGMTGPASLTATYKNDPTLVKLTVVRGKLAGGAATAKLKPGATITLTADPCADNPIIYEFDSWRDDAGAVDAHTAVPTAATAVLTMPAHDYVVCASYHVKHHPEGTHALIVNKGTGTGFYSPAEMVDVVADAPSA
jgi:hypothetical protein